MRCKYYSTSGITSYSIDFLIYSKVHNLNTYFLHFLKLLRCLSLISTISGNCAILVLSNSHNDLIINFRWQATFDVHESLQKDLLSNEFELLLLMLLFNEIYLLKAIETLTCFEIYFLGKLEHKVIKVANCFQWLALLGRLKSFLH